MREGIYLHAVLHVPAERLAAWRGAMLRLQRERLRPVKGFAAIDMGDDDLLGCEVTVRGKASFEEALAAVRSLVTPARIERWSHVVDDGVDAISIEERGALRRDADVGDLLAYLRLAADEGKEFVEVTASESGVTLRGFLGSYDAYRDHRLPIAYAAVAAGVEGGGGTVTFLGEAEGEFVATFVDVEGETITVQDPDPQNLDEEDWELRLGGVARLGGDYEAWAKKASRARKKARP
jgi:hypothetical protein